MEKFKSFTEEKGKPYKLILFFNKVDEARDVSDASATSSMWKLMEKAADEAGIVLYRVDFNGMFIEKKNGKTYIHSYGFDPETDLIVLPNEKGDLRVPKQKPIEVSADDTVLFSRGLGTQGITNIQTWTDIINEFEYEGYLTVPTLKNWYMCCSKYLTDILCRRAGLRTPKTIPLTYSDDSQRVMKEFNDKFPVILKTSTGSQTGVGVLIMESMRSLNSTVQMLKFKEPTMPLLIQEFIKTDYDVRVIVLDGVVKGTMKREIIQGDDFRSNISLGAESDTFELTEIEERDSIKAAAAVGGRLTGVDFIPAKNREKEQPYILEVNSMPGFGGIEKIEKGMTRKILEHFKDRKRWNIDTNSSTVG